MLVTRPPAMRGARPRITIQRETVVAPKARGLSISDIARAAEPLDGPYLDYSRQLTPDGGVVITYKDLDTRLRHTLWRIFVWAVATGGEGWFFLHEALAHASWVNVLCLIALAIVNLLIVRKPVELYRTLEIRPEGMILDGADMFRAERMEDGWPEFRPGEDGSLILSGTYGTRHIEFLTARRFDDYDRMPQVFAAHFKDAVRQLWMPR